MGTKNYDNALDMITFSRASGGTSLRKISYGSELVTNGTFDDAGTGYVEVLNGTISYASATMFATATTNNTGVYQDVAVGAGSTCEVSWDQVSGTNLRIVIFDGASFSTSRYDNGTGNSDIGTKTAVVVSTTGTLRLYLHTSTGNTAEFDNISVQEVLFDQPDGTLTLFNHPTNIPRIDYSPDGTVKGLLIEEARTNLLTYSSEFDKSAWQKVRSTVLSNATTAPDGTLTADKVIDNDEDSTHTLQFADVAATTFTYTLYAKAGELETVGLQPATDLFPLSLFNLITGTVVSSGSGLESSITSAGDGWWRLRVSGTSATGQVSARVIMHNAAGSALYVGSGTGLYIYGAQLEAGSFPTSYIPTSGATATRAADIASLPVTDFGYNQGIGSLVVEADPIPSGSGFGTKTIVDISNGGVNSQISLLNENSDRCRLILDPEDTTNDADITVIGAEGSVMYAAAWKLNSANAAHGGILGTEDTSNVPIKNATQVTLSSDVGGNAKFSGHIKSIQYYPRRLTNVQLQELTS